MQSPLYVLQAYDSWQYCSSLALRIEGYLAIHVHVTFCMYIVGV